LIYLKAEMGTKHESLQSTNKRRSSMRRIGSAGVSAILCWLAANYAEAQEIGVPGRGLILARQMCSECHAVDRTQAGSPNVDAPRFEQLANTRGMSAMALTVALRTPHRTMPNLVLDPEELSHIVAHIMSLRRAP
jgi:mono/diheme cytochrome c family protein